MLFPPPDSTVPEAQPSPQQTNRPRWWRFTARRRLGIAACIVGIPILLAVIVFSLSYRKYSRLIDARLNDGPFRDSVDIYASPLTLSTGDQLTAGDLIAELRSAGYESKAGNKIGSYRIVAGGVEVTPGNSGTGIVVWIAHDSISRLVVNRKDVREAALGSPLITTLSAHNPT